MRLSDGDGLTENNVSAYADFRPQNYTTAADRPYLAVHYIVTNYGKEVRAYTGFDLSGFPSQISNITGATLYVYRSGTQNDGNEVEPLIVDHVDYGDTLTAGDYSGVGIHNDIGTFNSGTGWVKVGVDTSITEALALFEEHRFSRLPVLQSKDGRTLVAVRT